MSNLSRVGSTGSLSGSSGARGTSNSNLNPETPGSISPSVSATGILEASSSSLSVHTPSNMGSEDEDSDGKNSTNLSYKERRREAHTQAEQKRRDAIKKGYDYLQDLVPTCNQGTSEQSGSGHKVSKAAVLQKSIDYIQFVQQQNKKSEDELALLRKEVIALEIMRGNYDQLVKAHQSQPLNKENTFVPNEVKFQTFQLLMDRLFNSFNEQVGMSNFSELSGCVFSWLEEKCKPQLLQETMYDVLNEVKERQQQLQTEQQETEKRATQRD